MAYTAYRMLKVPVAQIEKFMAEAIAEGWQPFGPPIMQYPASDHVLQAIVQGTPEGGGGPATITSEDISDASETGKSVLTAEDAAAARTAIGAGTSSLSIGTTSSTAKAGDYQPAWEQVSEKPAVIAAGADAASARLAIGAGTSSVVIGSGGSQAAAGNHDHSITADAGSGLAAAANLQALAVALSTRIKALEDAAV